jgi:hypothetical protein
VNHRPPTPSVRAGLTAAALLLSVGCAHPNLRVDPFYASPASDAKPSATEAAQDTAIAIRVTDQRRFKGEVRDDGSEVLASGDKGKVILETPAAEYFEQHLAEAYRAAGFDVRDDAEVALDVKLRELRFEALAFTHWGLPSDRASTLDVAGLLLPGPPRDTRALTVLDVDLNKNGQDVGLSYYIEGYAHDENAGKDPAVVARVVSESWSDAIHRTVASTAAGLPVVAARSVTAEERQAAEAEIAQQRAELEAVLAELRDREQQLAGDRNELQAIRRELEADRQALAERSVENERQVNQLQSQLTELQVQINAARLAQAQDDSDEEAQLADLEKQKRDLLAQQANFEQTAKALQEQRDQLRGQTQRIAAQVAELEQQRQLFDRRADELAAQEQAVRSRRTELQDWNVALAEWKARLAEAEAQIQTREAAFRQREAEVAKTEAELATKAEQLAALERQRQAMTQKVAPPAVVESPNARPIVYVARPETLTPTTKEQILVTGHVFDDREVVRTQFSINGKEIRPEEQKGLAFMATANAREIRSSRTPSAEVEAGGDRAKGTGVRSSGGGDSKGFVQFSFVVLLMPGHNRIRVEAWDDRGASDYAEFDVERKTDRGLVHVVAIGVNAYDTANHGVPRLRYAVDDAKAISDALARNLGITGRHIQLYDADATRSNIIEALRKTLPGNVSKQDTVVVFFSGHGAPETLAGGVGDSGDDNLVRYLLPVEAEADNLIGSAIPMQDIARYFRLLPCERLIFLADTCYSGGIAEGGRTLAADGNTLRGVSMSTVQLVNDTSGRGRVIITASKDNEIAHEKEELGHGVFTYHLVMGLDGAADGNADRRVTVRELYDYVADEVAKTTGGSQNPQINDSELRGDIVLARQP